MLLRWFKQYHWGFLFSMAGLILLGTLFIHSASHREPVSFMMKQVFWAGCGVLVLFLVPSIGYRTFLGMSGLFYLVSLLLLLWVDVAGAMRLGAQRWIAIGPFAIQPSEFAKLSTVLVLAGFLGEKNPKDNQFGTVLAAIVIVMIPFVMVAKQPDLGSGMIFIPILVSTLFIWGLRKRYFVIAGMFVSLILPLSWKLLKGYQKKRILIFLDPSQDPLGAGYTAIQSKIAVGSGGLWGKGYMAGTQSQLQFVPEHHTDFIFCVMGEEWGFVGTVVLLVLFAWLFRSIFQIMQSTTDVKAKLMIAGIASAIFAQLFINIGMTFGMMPIAGITLPFVSYGGSSLVATMFAMGLILSVYRERSIF